MEMRQVSCVNYFLENISTSNSKKPKRAEKWAMHNVSKTFVIMLRHLSILLPSLGFLEYDD